MTYIIYVIYGLCAFTSFLCAWLLLHAYRRSRYRMLLWGGLCFFGMTLDNTLVILDKFIFLDIDLSMWRGMTSTASIAILLYGLIWDTE